MIDGGTGLVGLLGNPVKHSLSPVMHNAALQAMALNWRYLALPCTSEHLSVVLEGLRAVDCQGLNVTIPHKQSVADLCSDLSPLAQRLGAVNTLIPLDNGGWHGHNTDVEGFLAPLGAKGAWTGQHAVVLGYGGSARAVVAGLQSLDLASITLVGRRAEGLDGFCQSMATPQQALDSCLETDQALPAVVERADLIVNTTPVGMNQHGTAGAVPLEPSLWQRLRSDAIEHLTNGVMSSDEVLGDMLLDIWLHEGHPYGHPLQGTVTGLDAITLEHVKGYYQSTFTLDNVTVGLSGAVDDALVLRYTDAMMALPEEAF